MPSAGPVRISRPLRRSSPSCARICSPSECQQQAAPPLGTPVGRTSRCGCQPSIPSLAGMARLEEAHDDIPVRLTQKMFVGENAPGMFSTIIPFKMNQIRNV